MRIIKYDVFTQTVDKGNPVGIITDADSLSPEVMRTSHMMLAIMNAALFAHQIPQTTVCATLHPDMKHHFAVMRPSER